MTKNEKKTSRGLNPVESSRRRNATKVSSGDLLSVQKKILAFRNARDWGQFHDPKNLAEALSIEAGELLENFLWKTVEQSRTLTKEELKNVREELADIFIFSTYLCEEFSIDILEAVKNKIAINSKKYPIAKSKGSNKKYTRR